MLLRGSRCYLELLHVRYRCDQEALRYNKTSGSNGRIAGIHMYAAR